MCQFDVKSVVIGGWIPARTVESAARIRRNAGAAGKATFPAVDAETVTLVDDTNREMNERHLLYLASPMWAAELRTDLLPWLKTVPGLDGDVLEIGPGPGLTTDLLRELATAVTAVEVDAGLAAALKERSAAANVDVVHGDGTAMPLPPNRFSVATCFSMLHHMPSGQDQDRLFAEVHRVLRPDGVFVGVDAVDSERIREAHAGDTFVPVDPATLADRLELAGFTGVTVDLSNGYRDRGGQFRFTAIKRH
ncbi:class I SAM-dependent methyltransferase [Nocardia sp. alder85J]|uniref:class I SAM-dependent methyltransferase n=1 Tax=Nocardia sp. alder85J TaxID=2862949 RepID=UPI001CD2B583|nr:class I SAM-dependent methyltransferase [Nocardia sp. alder85J]MCX4098595.1 class I SAM-dependent methyltransferase [Nocardia sp. alder85J]